jgi:hypothetical protein
MVERKTSTEYVQRGFTRSDRNPDMLIEDLPTPAEQARVGIKINKPLTLSINDAAWTSHPIQMFLASAYDYVVLPVAGTGAAAWGGSKLMNGGGNTKNTTTTISADHGGQVNVNHGPGTANQAGPSTTSTSSTTGL